MWAVAYTHAQKETVAQQQLMQQNFEVYLPCFAKKVTHARKTRTIKKPLFPRYLFLHINNNQSWRCINSTRGIQYLLLNTNLTPKTIPALFLKSLKQQEDDDGLIQTAFSNPLQPGAPVLIQTGSFNGQVANVISLSDEGRVKILLDILGSSTMLEVPNNHIEAI